MVCDVSDRLDTIVLHVEAKRVRTFNDREEYYGGEDWAGVLVEALPEDIDLVLSCWL